MSVLLVSLVGLYRSGYTDHHHFICPIIQQYAHLHRYSFGRAGQQGPTRTLTAAL